MRRPTTRRGRQVRPVHGMRGSLIFAVLRLHVRIVLVSLLVEFEDEVVVYVVGVVVEQVDDVLNVVRVCIRRVREQGGKALDVLGYKSCGSVEHVQVLAEVEVVEEEHRRTDGAFEEVVHCIGFEV